MAAASIGEGGARVAVGALVAAGVVGGVLGATAGPLQRPASDVTRRPTPPATALAPGLAAAATLVSGRAPAGAVVVGDTADAQALVSAHRPGTSFLLAAGYHHGFSVVPRTGDRFYARPGTVLDGDGDTTSAFGAVARGVAADRVTVVGFSARRPLVVVDYGTPGGDQQTAAIQAAGRVRAPGDGAPPAGSGWHLQWVAVDRAGARGITLSDGMVVVACQVRDAGRLGIGGGGRDLVVADSLVEGNGVGADRKAFEAGGIKTVGVGVAITHDEVEDNGGTGIWTDGDASSVTIEGDVVSGNLTGIHVEISHGVTVAGDVVDANRRTGILVTGSDGVRVEHDRLEDDGGGILLGGIDRGTGRRGPRILTAVTVAWNRVVDSGLTGLHQALPPGRRVTFDHDTYVGDRFVWNGRPVSFAQWQAAGQERQGTATP